jgi:chemotaxis signal transduction protein
MSGGIMSEGDDIFGIATQLRDAFDRGFGDQPAELLEPMLGFLHIGVAGHSYLVELTEISGVDAGAAISPLPSTAPALLGIVGLQGDLVPVFSLARMLGLDADGGRPHWIMLNREQEIVGFAFDLLKGHVSLAREDVAPLEAGLGPRHVQATALAAGVRYPILRLGMLLEELRSGAAVLANKGRG